MACWTPFKVRYNESMSLVILEEGAVPIPEDLAQEFGLHKGSSFQWERTEDGALKLRPAMTREEAIEWLRGSLKDTLKPGENGMESFLKWRQEERELDPTYQQW